MRSLETRVAFDALIATVVAPELKSRGYRKRGLRWSRSRNDVKTEIRVQQEKVPAVDEVCFTIDFEVRTGDAGLTGKGDVRWRVHAGVLSRPDMPRVEPDLVVHEIADAVTRLDDTLASLTSVAAIRGYAAEQADLVQRGLLRLRQHRSA